MAVNKNFVVKNGIEVANDLIFASSDQNKVGIGSTQPDALLEVGGDFKALGNSTIVGFATIQDTLKVGSGGTGFIADIQSGRFGFNTDAPQHNVHILNVGSGLTSLYVDGGNVVFTGDLSGYNADFSGDVNLSSGNLVVGGAATITSDLIIGGATSITSNLVVGGATSINSNLIVGGAATITSDLTVSSNLIVTGDISYDEATGRNLNITGIATIATVDINGGDIEVSNVDTTDLNVTGISTLGTVQVSNGEVTSTSGVVTYFGDGSNLTGVTASAGGSIGFGAEGTFVGSGVTQININSSTGSNVVASSVHAGIVTATIIQSGVSIGLAIALGS
tara:strand:- start:929 stop:1933 length:1005 start_codon:yes stop_codon:yes gene_type:complete